MKNIEIKKDIEGNSRLYLESARIEELMHYALENSITRFVISSYHGFEERDITFLVDFKSQITGLSFLDEYYDLTVLNSLDRIRNLGIPTSFKGIVDFANLPLIQSLTIPWNLKKLKSLHSLNNLNEILIDSFTGKNLSREEFPLTPKLKDISFMNPKFTSLEGIERFQSLEKLQIWNGRKLQDISAIQHLSSSLKRLELEKLKSIKELTPIGNLEKCERLLLSDMGTIPSLGFVDGMTHLKAMSFVGTTIEDGDLSVCERLEYAGFFDKKHYSHKSKDFAKKWSQGPL